MIALETQKPLANWQANRYFTPASNTKLLTALAAAQTFDTLPLLFYQKDSLQHCISKQQAILCSNILSFRQAVGFFSPRTRGTCYHISDDSPLNRLGPVGLGRCCLLFFSRSSVFPVHGNVIQMSDPVAQSITALPCWDHSHPIHHKQQLSLDFDRMYFLSTRISLNPPIRYIPLCSQ